MTPKKQIHAVNLNLPKLKDSLGRLQPQELEFEKSVLGALLLEKDAYSLISDILTPESFYDPRNQKVYSAISKLHVAQHPVRHTDSR